MYSIDFIEEWDKYFSKLDKSEKAKLWKKIQQLKELCKVRHLKHNLPYYVVESGQYRIGFEQIKKNRRVMFAGNHKQYEKWIRTAERGKR